MSLPGLGRCRGISLFSSAVALGWVPISIPRSRDLPLLWRGCHTSGLQGAPCTECIGHPLSLLCGSLGQPRRRPAFFQRKGHAWKSDGVRGSRCFKEVALQSTERSFTNDMENLLLDTTRYPHWGTPIGNPHRWTEPRGGGNPPKPQLPPQVVVVVVLEN